MKRTDLNNIWKLSDQIARSTNNEVQVRAEIIRDLIEPSITKTDLKSLKKAREVNKQ